MSDSVSKVLLVSSLGHSIQVRYGDKVINVPPYSKLVLDSGKASEMTLPAGLKFYKYSEVR